MPDRDVALIFLRWTGLRAVFHRGYWLVTSLYLVAEADLSPFQLVFIGTAQGITALAFEIPTGVMADTVSRKWSVVIAHLLIGTGMVATGFLTRFPVPRRHPDAMGARVDLFERRRGRLAHRRA